MKITYWTTLLFCLCLANNANAAVENYTLDPLHTYVLWHINHLGFSNPSGKWFASGTLSLDTTQPQNSKVNVAINMANLITGIPELDNHLKEKLFFDVAHFPTTTFKSEQVKLLNKNTAMVYGNLTLHGITKPLVIKIVLNNQGLNPITNKITTGFSGTTKIKRSDFNINTLLPEIGDAVSIEIEAEAYKESV